ncbi:MAG: O-antigen ligase family protein [Patescibacteria group bacterium]
MDKRTKKITEVLLFIYLILFPFGQLPSFTAKISEASIRAHPADIVALVIAAVFLTKKFAKPNIWRHFKNLLYGLGFSLIFSLTIFEPQQLLIGFLYLLRLIGYSFFFLAIWNYLKRVAARKILFGSLIAVSLFSSLFGLLQYFVYPDVRALVEWGWDDHLYRLVGTFLDPSFTSIFLVFGFLGAFAAYIRTRKKYFLPLLAVILISITLTYSRAGYLALFAGLTTLLFINKKLKRILSILALFLFILAAVPNWGSEGVRLLRTRSIFARLTSYSEAIALTSKSPVFGIVYNNLCIAKEKFLGNPANYDSHSCSGVESGLLLLLATSGIVGLFMFVYLILKLGAGVGRDLYGTTFIASGAALLVHSLFVNSLFYPWVMGWMGILLAISLKEKNLRK